MMGDVVYRTRSKFDLIASRSRGPDGDLLEFHAHTYSTYMRMTQAKAAKAVALPFKLPCFQSQLFAPDVVQP